jgi:hypothetical protein
MVLVLSGTKGKPLLATIVSALKTILILFRCSAGGK